MNLMPKLAARAEAGRPVRCALIGAGKFGSMFLAQVPHIAGLEVTAIADLDPERAKNACRTVGWDEARIAATRFVDSGVTAAEMDGVEVVIEATGHPAAGARHALAAIAARRHVVMVNVEADVLVGPVLAAKARAAGVVYSMAYGDQPALVAEMVDWARATGFTVAAAGKGTKYLPAYHRRHAGRASGAITASPPEAAQVGRHESANVQLLPRRHQIGDRDGGDRRMPAVSMSSADGLLPSHPAASTISPHIHAATKARRRPAGPRTGVVEVVSSLERDGRPVFRDLRWGVYVVLKAPNPYAAACFKQYGLPTGFASRRSMRRCTSPIHLIGLELSLSVLNAALRGEPTGATGGFWRRDAVATAKRDLKAGEMLDGEGGYTASMAS
jgi:predicted homoserine dehydrogenase-like protein